MVPGKLFLGQKKKRKKKNKKIKKNKGLSHNLLPKKLSAMCVFFFVLFCFVCFIFFYMEILFYSVFGPLFFFFFCCWVANFLHFFLGNWKKKIGARHLRLYRQKWVHTHTYARGFVSQTFFFFFLALQRESCALESMQQSISSNFVIYLIPRY